MDVISTHPDASQNLPCYLCNEEEDSAKHIYNCPTVKKAFVRPMRSLGVVADFGFRRQSVSLLFPYLQIAPPGLFRARRLSGQFSIFWRPSLSLLFPLSVWGVVWAALELHAVALGAVLSGAPWQRLCRSPPGVEGHTR